MIVDPQEIVAQGIVTLDKHSKIQQSGIDITIRNIRKIVGSDSGRIIYEDVVLPNMLDAGSAYDFECFEHVEIPKDMVAIIITRSTYNRRGAFVTTGLYDNGFKNFIGGVLHTTTPLYIPLNERIAQIVFFETDHEAEYDGQYNEKK